MRLGDFTLEQEIGRGGMGVVYRAWQESLGREVALKLLRDGVLADPALVARFRAEVLASAGLQHHGIVRVHEVGETAGLSFFTMDLVEGPSLAKLVRAEGPMPPRRAAEISSEVADAIHYAHEMGVIHRDLKPANVLIDPHGRAKVLDFGLARREGAEDLTLSGETLGTPGYAAPEQIRGEKHTGQPATDVYGLGAVLFFLLFGHPPHEGKSTSDLIRLAQGNWDPPSTPPNAPLLPADLMTICLKCLRSAPADRYGTAREVAQDLRRWLVGQSILGRPLPFWRRLGKWLRKRRRAVLGTALGLALLIAGGVWVRYQYRWTWPHPIYCGEVKRTVDGPEPTADFDRKKWQSREINLRVTRRGSEGPVIRIESISGAGIPTIGGIRPPFYEESQNRALPLSIDLEYDARGRLLEETLRGKGGKFIARSRWSYPADDAGLTRSARVDFFNAAGDALETGTLTRAARLRANAEGEWNEVYFLDALGQPTLGDQGVYGRRISRPVLTGLRTEFLDQDGQLMNNALGVARQEYHTDEAARRQELRYFNRDQQPVSPLGYHLRVTQFDQAGNPVEISYFSADGITPARAPGEGEACSHLLFRRDEHGHVLEVIGTGFDLSISPTHSRRQSFTRRQGQVTTQRVEFFDTGGAPCLNNEGFQLQEDVLDALGRVSQESTSGYDGSKGFVKRVTTFTYAGPAPETDSVRTEYFDAAGQLVTPSK